MSIFLKLSLEKDKVFLIILLSLFNLNLFANNDEFINVVSSRQDYLIEPIFNEFTKDTGIKVNYVILNSKEAIKIINLQGKNTQVDAFLAVDASNLYEAQQVGIFQTIRSKVLNKNIPSYLQDPSKQWFGLSLRVRSLIYNTNVDISSLKNYASIGDKRWKNKLVLRTSSRIYNKSMVAMMIAQYGYSKTKIILKSWVNNLAMKPLLTDNEVIKNISEGKGDIGIVNSYYLARMLKKNPLLNVKMHFLGFENNKVHVNITGIGITRYAKRKNNAIKLVHWLSSKKGQKLFADIDMEYPVNKKVKPNELLKKWGTFAHLRINVRKTGELRADAVKLMKEVSYE